MIAVEPLRHWRTAKHTALCARPAKAEQLVPELHEVNCEQCMELVLGQLDIKVKA